MPRSSGFSVKWPDRGASRAPQREQVMRAAAPLRRSLPLGGRPMPPRTRGTSRLARPGPSVGRDVRSLAERWLLLLRAMSDECWSQHLRTLDAEAVRRPGSCAFVSEDDLFGDRRAASAYCSGNPMPSHRRHCSTRRSSLAVMNPTLQERAIARNPARPVQNLYAVRETDQRSGALTFASESANQRELSCRRIRSGGEASHGALAG